MKLKFAFEATIVLAMVFISSFAAPPPSQQVPTPIRQLVGEENVNQALSKEDEHQLSKAVKMNAASFAFQTAIVFASNAKLLGGKTNPEVNEDYPSLMTPAGYAFSIWGAIYAWEFLMVAQPFFQTPTGTHRSAIVSSSPYFVSANVLQAFWALTFAHEKIALSTVFLTAIAVNMARAVTVMGVSTPREKRFWFLAAPSSLHAGWVAAASIVSFNLALVAEKGSIASQISLAFNSLALALVAGFTAFKQLPPGSDALYSGAISWGLVAIADELHKKVIPRIDPACKEGLQGTALLYGGFLAAASFAAAVLSGTKWKF